MNSQMLESSVRGFQTPIQVIDSPFPAQFDAEEKRWMFEDGAISWDDVLKRWKGRGPKNEEYVEHLQRGYKELYASTAS